LLQAIFCIHNIAYQGVFDSALLPVIPPHLLHYLDPSTYHNFAEVSATLLDGIDSPAPGEHLAMTAAPSSPARAPSASLGSEEDLGMCSRPVIQPGASESSGRAQWSAQSDLVMYHDGQPRIGTTTTSPEQDAIEVEDTSVGAEGEEGENKVAVWDQVASSCARAAKADHEHGSHFQKTVGLGDPGAGLDTMAEQEIEQVRVLPGQVVHLEAEAMEQFGESLADHLKREVIGSSRSQQRSPQPSKGRPDRARHRKSSRGGDGDAHELCCVEHAPVREYSVAEAPGARGRGCSRQGANEESCASRTGKAEGPDEHAASDSPASRSTLHLAEARDKSPLIKPHVSEDTRAHKLSHCSSSAVKAEACDSPLTSTDKPGEGQMVAMERDALHWTRRRKPQQGPNFRGKRRSTRDSALQRHMADKARPMLQDGSESQERPTPWAAPSKANFQAASDNLHQSNANQVLTGPSSLGPSNGRAFSRALQGPAQSDASQHGRRGQAQSADGSAERWQGQRGPLIKAPPLVNWLLGGIRGAAAVATVSPSYAHEVCTCFLQVSKECDSKECVRWADSLFKLQVLWPMLHHIVESVFKPVRTNLRFI
jgi:hypothetical protein